MRFPLRLRVLSLVFGINAVVFGSGLVYLVGKIADARKDEGAQILDATLANMIIPGGDLKVAEILASPQWRHFADAIVVDRNLVRSRGEVVPLGVHLNPLGSVRRTAAFDRKAVLDELATAVDTGQRVEGRAGTAVPIFDPDGRLWGASWYRLETTVDTGKVALSLVPWFLLSTMLLTFGTFWTMRRFVLAPVEDLARGAERLGAGDLAARIEEPRRSDELSDLIRGFNAMASTVQGFNATLEREVARATEQARAAEVAAVTQRRLAATGELAAGIAHEINNPLGGLLNAAESLSRADLPPAKRREYQDLLRGGLERIQATVGRLLRLAPRQARPQALALVDPVLDAIGLVAHRADALGVAIELACDGRAEEAVARARRLPSLSGEPNELAQAVLNLLVNALDALEDLPRGTGRIQVDVRREAGELVLSVADNGPGVAAESLPRISDAFYSTKDVGRGTGLGLAIVQNVVASHGGRVELFSRPGEGFRAKIHLPVVHGAPGGSSSPGGGASS